MRHIWTIFKKEMRYTLRDKRTVVIMVIIPLLLFPMIFIITGKVQSAAAKDEFTRTLRVGYFAPGGDHGLHAMLAANPTFNVRTYSDTAQFRALVREDSLDIALALSPTFDQSMVAQGSDSIVVWYDQTREAPLDRVQPMLYAFESKVLDARLDSLGITRANIEPFELVEHETSSKQEIFGKVAGGFLPYIFIAFCYMGCMFPAVDLFTGEKERGTIETILSTPVDRWKILVGKMMVVVTSGMTTAFLALFGLLVGLNISEALPQVVMDIVLSILTPTFVIGFLLMLLPLVICFAGMMIPATIYAKSYKEAQSILTPLNFLVITPAIVGMMPGIELNLGTAFIPVLNVVLATKDLIAGSLDYGLFAIVMASLLVIAVAAVTISFRRFGNEKNILRT